METEFSSVCGHLQLKCTLHITLPDFVFQDDNSYPHRTHIVLDFLEYQGVEHMEWPKMVPDLNPIEHLWDQIGRQVAAHVEYESTLEDLRFHIVDEWDALPQINIER